MEKVFSTQEVHPRDRFDYWHSVACKNVVDHECRPQSRLTFHAGLEAGILGDIGLVVFENSPMDVSHMARHISHASNDDLFLCRQLAGGLALEQDDREAILEAGDMALLDTVLPYDGRFSLGSKLLVIKIPRRALEVRVGKTRNMVARVIKPCEAEIGLTSSFLAMLPTYAGRMSSAAEEIVKGQALDLVAMSLAKMMGGRPQASSARGFVMLNVRAAIEARLADPALDAQAVAAAAGISVRYANAVLAQDDTSVTRLILARRLDRCRKALVDPLQAHRSLSDIAYGWGFTDMTHFGRSFKKAYAMLPSEYRKSAANQ